ncbi:F-box only protein 28 [Toxocara canis]|uniref:F-box only protein 28 n=1 Tax=Toxocara canis TaxID=6265 RepID=A0A0B2USN1_TOXCA|nr:F-box only protein 28 [Toxocara canis]
MFCDLPMEVVTHILSFLTFEELSFARAVSKNFDALARSLLNASFFRLGEQLELAMGNVKKMLPKRESQRRNHSLSRVNEVYSALETRYALLGMTFRKHIDDDSCCFIAGKVLDEAFALLRTLNSCVKRNEQPRETQELLKDIRDYSRLQFIKLVDVVNENFGTLYDTLCFFSDGVPAWCPAALYIQCSKKHSVIRPVSKNFDALARSLLNASFFRLGEQLELAMGNVKKMLPKRESQRRNHSLSRVNEVYSALETRYALLGMTFRKHIDDDSCCFIAGKVLDEAFALLRTLNSCVKRNEQPRETQELLKDIRDYSSMAMEYFDEQIAPTLRTKDPLSLLYRSHGRCPSFSIALPRSAPASINASLRSLCNSPCASTSSLCGGGSSVLGEMSKLFEWRKDVEEKLKKQERAIREQGAAINNIIECMHQISAKISLNCTKGLKTLGESSCSHFGETDASVRSNSLLTVPSSETRGRKRKADSCVGLTHKISTRVLSDT